MGGTIVGLLGQGQGIDQSATDLHCIRRLLLCVE